MRLWSSLQEADRIREIAKSESKSLRHTVLPDTMQEFLRKWRRDIKKFRGQRRRLDWKASLMMAQKLYRRMTRAGAAWPPVRSATSKKPWAPSGK